MGFLGNLFRKNAANEEAKVGGIEDFMTLIRVYYQAVMAIMQAYGRGIRDSETKNVRI